MSRLDELIAELCPDGVEYKTPYILHVLRVCSTLISIVGTTMPNEELDILLTSALLHDTLEDCKQFFPLGGQELVLNYGFPKEVYTVVSLVTKSAGYTDEQLLQIRNFLYEIAELGTQIRTDHE